MNIYEDITALIRIKGKLSSPSLGVDDCGSGGLPVVFVHSMVSSAWTPTRGKTSSSFGPPWPRQFGVAEDGDFAIESMAGDLEIAVNELGIERFVLVGHVSGGMVAIAYAGMQTEKVAGLLLADPSRREEGSS